MNFKLYDNKLLAPVKCGTRYLDLIFKDNQIGFSMKEIKNRLFLSNITDIIIRPPMEHLASALHTEILTAHNHTERDKDVPFDALPIINEFCWYSSKDEQNTHWSYDTYESLYWLWRRNKNKINIIELKDLSSYLEKLNIKDLPKYDSKDYEFRYYANWCTKDEMMLFVKKNYTEHWDNLMEQVENANVFYNLLMNKELIEIKLV
jgi:hypothetical protein